MLKNLGGVAPALKASFERSAQDRRTAEEAAQRRREVRQRLQQSQDGALVPLKDQVFGWSKGGSSTWGRPPNEEPRTGTAAGFKSNRRQLGAPVLRRDPSAQEKLNILRAVGRAMTAAGTSNPRKLPSESKRRLERDWTYPYETVVKWLELKPALEAFVAKSRVGLHGLRPFGSNLPKTAKGSLSKGARLRAETSEPTKQQPLNGVLHRLKVWFNKERYDYNHEVRERHVNLRLKVEMEAERDRQAVLKAELHRTHNPAVLKACEEKLKWFVVSGGPEKQDTWLQQVVWPKIGCRPRAGQHKAATREELDKPKTLVTWASADRALYVAFYGTEEELRLHVADPKRWIQGRKKLWLFFLDETPLWIKLRGEERVLRGTSELLASEERHKVSKALKAARDKEERAVAEAALKTWQAEHLEDEHRPKTYTFFSQAGDKHRLTLVNISAVEHWGDVEEVPKGHKKVMVLVVFAAETCRAEDIDENGCWNKDVTYETDEGTVRHKKGESAGNLLKAWRDARDSLAADLGLDTSLRIWGQQNAWVNRLICVWLAELLEEVYGQGVLWCDALAARWSEASVLEHWGRNLFMTPYVQGTTTWLQPPDTHEHAPLKAVIKSTKADLHFELEQAALQAGKDFAKRQWGPRELLWVVSKALGKFREQHPLVPLQGAIDNQMLALRPSRENGLELLEDCKEESTQQLLQIPGIKRSPPGTGIAAAWCRLRDAAFRALPVDTERGTKVPPVPDWDNLENTLAVQDDMPKVPDATEAVWVEFEAGLEDLNLSAEQKRMLLPVEARICALQRPAAIERMASNQRNMKRKNKWCQKFKGESVGKHKRKWAERLAAEGKEQCLEDLRRKAGPVAKAKAKAKAKAVAKAGAKAQALGKFAGKNAKAKAEARQQRGQRKPERTEVELEPLQPKEVRVTDEAAGEALLGRVGAATRAFEVTVLDSKFVEWGIVEVCVASTAIFRARAEWCSEVQPGEQVPLRMYLDYRQVKVTQRNSVASALPDNVEHAEAGTMLEASTIAAAFKELELRFKDVASEFHLVDPSVAHSLAHQDGIPHDHGGEGLKAITEIKATRCTIVAIHEAAHYTYLELTKDAEAANGEGFRVVYKDSWEGKVEASRQRAKQLCLNLGLLECSKDVQRSNTAFQVGGWECGLWVVRWAEARLRALRGEPVSKRPSLTDVIARTNEFIGKVKPQAKAKAKGESRARKGKATRQGEWATADEAFQAAKDCTVCHTRVDGFKGCKACMGEWFEPYRLRKAAKI